MAVLILLPAALLAGQAMFHDYQITDVHACAAPVATSGTTHTTADRWITDLRVALATPPDQLRGRRIWVTDARIEQVDDAGFWIGGSQDGCRLYVRPAEGPLIRVTVGELVDLEGEFRFRASPTDGREPRASVYAYIVRQSPSENR